MGSTGYLTCGICWQCGKCYPRASACASCGEPISLDLQACPTCGCVITEHMRIQAQEAFKQEKLAEFQATMNSKTARPVRL